MKKLNNIILKIILIMSIVTLFGFTSCTALLLNMVNSSKTDYFQDVISTSDNGFLAVGAVKSVDVEGLELNGGTDMYVTKFDEFGEVQWQKNFGGSANDYANAVREAKDGGYIIAGSSNSINIDGVNHSGSYDFFIIKLNSLGEVEWQRMFGDIGDEFCYSVDVTEDGGYVLGGFSDSSKVDNLKSQGNSDCYVVKLDKDGMLEWQTLYGTKDDDQLYQIEQTKDGGYAFVITQFYYNLSFSSRERSSYEQVVLIKTDSEGEIEWQKNYINSGFSSGFDLKQTEDEGFIIVGSSSAENVKGDVSKGKTDFYIIKTDLKGEIVWQKLIGGNKNDRAYKVHITNDNGFVIVGDSSTEKIGEISSNGEVDVYAVKLDADGEKVWDLFLGGAKTDKATSVCQTYDNEYIVVGMTYSVEVDGLKGGCDAYVAKIDMNGLFDWHKAYGGSK